jgi:hypothetical protein
MKIASLCVGGVVALIFGAGFFHEDAVEAPAPAKPARPVSVELDNTVAWGDNTRGAAGNLLNSGRLYRLQCEFTLKVKAVLNLEEKLKGMLEDHKGTIEQLEITGTERGREGTAVVSVPTDHFDPFVKSVRELGQIKHEHVTAVSWKPGRATGGAPEFAVVTLSFSDIGTSPAVDESKGILATSFDRGAAHFLKGSAVMVEGLGYALPYAIAMILILGPTLAILRLRARRAAADSLPAGHAAE